MKSQDSPDWLRDVLTRTNNEKKNIAKQPVVINRFEIPLHKQMRINPVLISCQKYVLAVYAPQF